ncbi:DUF308 domain-containing protein [Hymenobacter tibetensis]|uniref:DUF308 domain-containing protein n=1 Tax=Hymenobacter tibetensis TaxID=497967 RepID=A0ABY4CUC3_9BACT|nr:DUF308 domain-containing protein [Hymenobacter tibetensis]UOG73864.1 DUF308 domain-containing protein [Hymenobacter tibetensis]
MKPYFYAFLLLSLFLGGCNSARSVIYLPNTTRYSATPSVPPAVEKPIPAVVQNKSEVLDEPQFTAALSVREVTQLHSKAQQLRRKALLTHGSLKTMLIERPDTNKAQLPDKALIGRTRDADTFTTVVNVVGGILALVGIILIIAAFTSTSPGWLPLAYLVYGVLALILGTPFLLFRSKNSTRKRKAEERRAVRRAARSQQ